ncbi:hypothetical protein ACWER9_06350 [Micromonospora sp. NPDC003944]
MSRLDEPYDRAAVTFSARLTVNAHAAGRRCCIECPGAGCRQEAWARDALGMAPHATPQDHRPYPMAG